MIDAETKIYSAIKLGDRITRSQSQDRGRALSSIPSSDYPYNSHLGLRQFVGGAGGGHLNSGGSEKRESPDFRPPEVGISEIIDDCDFTK